MPVFADSSKNIDIVRVSSSARIAMHSLVHEMLLYVAGGLLGTGVPFVPPRDIVVVLPVAAAALGRIIGTL